MFDRLRSEVRYRWRALAVRDRVEDELDDELRFHLEREADALEARGLAPAEARRLARARFGASEAVKDDVRDARGVALIEQTWADLRYVLRGLRQQRAFTLGVAGTLALGIGANVAVFGIVDRLLFRPPAALVASDRVHRVHLAWTADGERRTARHTAFPRLIDFARDSSQFDLVAGFQVRRVALGRGADTRQERIAVVSASYLDFFDAPPVLGRWFTAADDGPPTGRPVAVISHPYWLRRYGGRAEAIGQSLQVDRLEATIIGVAPPGFTGLTESGPPVVFVPMRAFAAALRGQGFDTYNWSWLEVLVRRKPGVGIGAATADITRVFRASWRAENDTRRVDDDLASADPAATLGPVQIGRGPDAGLDSSVALWIAGLALVVFLVACANVANLFLARAVSRQREVAMRLALGAGRARLTRQLGLESLVLGVLGGLGGVVMAWTTGGALRLLLLPEGTSADVLTDLRTLVFTFVLSVAAGALTLIVPALLAARLNLAGALKSGGRGATRPRTRAQAALVVVQAALSVVLLVSAAAFVMSLQRAQNHRLGFDADRLLVAEVNLRGTRVDDHEMRALVSRIEADTTSLPGVAAVTMAASVPFWSNEGRGLLVDGVENVRERGRFTLQAGSSEYFATTGTRILQGRGFTAADGAGAGLVMVVSEGMAEALWPGRHAIGQCVRVDSAPPEPGKVKTPPPCRTVVGVAEESAMVSLEPSREFTYYLPAAQYPEGIALQFFIRAHVAPAAVASAVRARVQPLLPGAAYVTVVPLGDLIAPQYRAWRDGGAVFAVFGVLALVLAALGLHSLVAYEVAQRQQEFGVRVALGASRVQVLRLVLSRGTRLVVAGVAAGLGLALALSAPLDRLLFHQSSRDPAVFVVVATTLLAVAALASLAPGLRATRVDPTEALRAE